MRSMFCSTDTRAHSPTLLWSEPTMRLHVRILTVNASQLRGLISKLMATCHNISTDLPQVDNASFCSCTSCNLLAEWGGSVKLISWTSSGWVDGMLIFASTTSRHASALSRSFSSSLNAGAPGKLLSLSTVGEMKLNKVRGSTVSPDRQPWQWHEERNLRHRFGSTKMERQWITILRHSPLVASSNLSASLRKTILAMIFAHATSSLQEGTCICICIQVNKDDFKIKDLVACALQVRLART